MPVECWLFWGGWGVEFHWQLSVIFSELEHHVVLLYMLFSSVALLHCTYIRWSVLGVWSWWTCEDSNDYKIPQRYIWCIGGLMYILIYTIYLFIYFCNYCFASLLFVVREKKVILFLSLWNDWGRAWGILTGFPAVNSFIPGQENKFRE